MTLVPVIPDSEALLGSWLREHPDVIELDARVAGRTPSDATMPWVTVTQLNARNVGGVEHLIEYLMQFDCYAGKDAMGAHRGQAEASLLARTVRAVLKVAQGQILDGVVITRVAFNGMPRQPDPDFEPARERYVLTATIHAHA